MHILKNPFFSSSETIDVPAETPFPSIDVAKPHSLLTKCPAYKPTALVANDTLAKSAGVSKLFLKDETSRMGLGSFKALGAAYVIAHAAAETGKKVIETALDGRTYVTASAGNHGLSVAAGASLFGARAIIYLSETVPNAFADRLREKGAEVRIEGRDYEQSMSAAQTCADENDFTLLSDSSWEGYYALPHRLMEGYLVSAKETADEIGEAPTHIFLQAGVGGLAGAMAAYFRHVWGQGPIITVVEPDHAPALQASIAAGKSVLADGPVSNMGRLDCKEPSLIALKGLARDANYFLTIPDELATDTTETLLEFGLASTPSGVAGLAGLFARYDQELCLDEASRVLCIVSEGDE